MIIIHSHFSRACDTLRIILSNFLPIIQANADRWSLGYGGVDITREERQKKCLECAHWLVKIKSIPDNKHMGSNLTQLQNLIIDVWDVDNGAELSNAEHEKKNNKITIK